VVWAIAGFLAAMGQKGGTGWAAPTGKTAICTRAVVEGEAREGQKFVKVIGNGLEVMLEPLASGWILRILPVEGPRPEHDYAELASPPYRSVSPLLISTDFSFRAQDAVAWNPRHFHFAADRGMFMELSEAYREYRSMSVPSASAMNKLAGLASRAPEGTVQLLDAHLVPGTGDQAKMAAVVASHFDATAHSLERPADGKGTPVGKITWIRFRISLELPEGFRADRGIVVKRYGCSTASIGNQSARQLCCQIWPSPLYSWQQKQLPREPISSIVEI
jgi:hypothetical protein